MSWHIAGERLYLSDWPGVASVARAQLSAQLRDETILIEWQGPDGGCALSVSKVSPGGTALRNWLPASRRQANGGTRRWLFTALFLTLGLPLLLLVLLFGFRDNLINAALKQISVEKEQQLADTLWQAQRARLRLLEGKAANRFVEDIGARLVATTATPYRYRFFVTDDPAVNAFAMPGGYVVVHTGLISKARTPEELAGVLAHEIEHVEQRHSLRGMIQAAGLSAAGLVITGDLTGGSAAWISQLAGLRFSREHETAADMAGVVRLKAAAIDPRGMASFFELLAQEQSAIPEAFSLLSTHPASKERVEALKSLLKDAAVAEPLVVDWPAITASIKR